MDEVLLLSKCRDNDSAAQKAFFTLYAGDMMLLCMRYVIQQEDAREVMMDGFLNFFRNLDQFGYRGSGSVKAWLKKIMVNQCLTFLRRKNPFSRPADAMLMEHIPDDDDTPVDKLTAKEIIQMIHALPDGYRTVFNLYVFEEMGHREIGEALGISENTSKSQLHRARAILKERILQRS
jgi:RNA polymerase sigma-70 factor (ECF subfamily)